MKPVQLLTSSLQILIIFYRTCISPFTPNVCRFYPSCSCYARDCITQFGVAKGGLLTLKRLARCHPFGGYGYDPPPTR